MPRPFERRSEANDTTATLSKQSGETSNLAQLRKSHGFKDEKTKEKKEIYDHQVHTKWQENEYKANKEVAKERAEQPWHPGNKMQLTREYGHPSRKDFSGALAGTPEQAKRYWEDPNSTRDPEEYRRLYFLSGESSHQADPGKNVGHHASNREYNAQTGKDSSQYEKGYQDKKRSLKRKDFSSQEEDREHLVQERNVESSYNYKNHLAAKEMGFESVDDYQNDIAQQMRLASHSDYRRYLEERDKDS